ncbi:MAG: twin-arginine translocase subunit TatC, partial [Candidatus Bathyarchaeia archaeon]
MAAAVGIISVLSFALTIRGVTVSGVKLYYLWPDVFHNIPSQVVDQAKGDLLPDFVDLIVTAPAQAIFAEVTISLFLGVLLGMPVLMYQTAKFVSPGLKPREETLIKALVVPASGLFAGGVIFAYFLVLPFTYNFLYLYAIAFGALTFLT